jgi:hypothetical protein
VEEFQSFVLKKFRDVAVELLVLLKFACKVSEVNVIHWKKRNAAQC